MRCRRPLRIVRLKARVESAEGRCVRLIGLIAETCLAVHVAGAKVVLNAIRSRICVAVAVTSKVHAVTSYVADGTGLPVHLPTVQVEVDDRIDLMPGEHDDEVVLILMASRRRRINDDPTDALRAVNDLPVRPPAAAS